MNTERLILLILSLTTCVYLGSAVRQYNRQQADIEEMNKTELHYDADGYFVMVNTAAEIVGVYDAVTPLNHYKCTVIQPAVTRQVCKVSELAKYGVTVPTELFDTVPAETPVLIY